MDYIKPDSVVKVFLRGRVKDTGRSYAVVDTFQLVKPDLTVKVAHKFHSSKIMLLLEFLVVDICLITVILKFLRLIKFERWPKLHLHVVKLK